MAISAFALASLKGGWNIQSKARVIRIDAFGFVYKRFGNDITWLQKVSKRQNIELTIKEGCQFTSPASLSTVTSEY